MLSLGKVASPSNLSFDKRVQPPSVVWLSSLCLFLQVFLFEFRSFVTSTRLDILITLSRSQYIGESILCTSRQPSGRRLRGGLGVTSTPQPILRSFHQNVSGRSDLLLICIV